MSTHSKSEIASMAITAAGMTAKNLPMIPAIKSSGAKAIIVVDTDAETAGKTSEVPSMAALSGFRPFS